MPNDYLVHITDLIEIECGQAGRGRLVEGFTLRDSVINLLLNGDDKGKIQSLELTLSRWPKITWTGKILSLKFGIVEMWFAITGSGHNSDGSVVVFANVYS